MVSSWHSAKKTYIRRECCEIIFYLQNQVLKIFCKVLIFQDQHIKPRLTYICQRLILVTCQITMVGFSHFHKKLHSRCLTGSQIRLCLRVKSVREPELFLESFLLLVNQMQDSLQTFLACSH